MEAVQLAYDVYEMEDTLPTKNPIILTHGLFWNKFMLKELARDLCEATRRKDHPESLRDQRQIWAITLGPFKYYVFCVDLRCHDQSPFREECDAFAMKEDLKLFIRERKLEKVVFVSHSFSCTLAYLVALDQPEKIEKLVMIDHPPFPDFSEHFYKYLVLPQFVSQNRFLSSLDPSMSLIAAKKRILNISKGAAEGQRHFLEKISYELAKEGNSFKWKTNHQFLIDKYRDAVFAPTPRGSSDLDILMIRCSDSARLTDKKFDGVLRHNPNAKLITFSNTTHLLMLEKQEEFVAAVQDFLL